LNPLGSADSERSDAAFGVSGPRHPSRVPRDETYPARARGLCSGLAGPELGAWYHAPELAGPELAGPFGARTSLLFRGTKRIPHAPGGSPATWPGWWRCSVGRWLPRSLAVRGVSRTRQGAHQPPGLAGGGARSGGGSHGRSPFGAGAVPRPFGAAPPSSSSSSSSSPASSSSLL